MLAKSLTAVASIAAIAVVCATGVSANEASNSGSIVGFTRHAIDSSASFPDPAATARAHRFVILHAWRQDVARQLKAANPEVKVLVYKNLSFVACDGYAYAGARLVPQGVRCPEVEASHPEWFLRDADGNRLSSGGYPWLRLVDVGNAAYQDEWVTNVISEAKAAGWDGVFLDDADPTLRYHMGPERVAKYPTDEAWAAATRSFLRQAGARIEGAGLLAIANICCTAEVPGVWKDWLQFLSGGMDEMFTKWGASPNDGYIWDWGRSGWSAKLQEVAEAEAQGKYFLGISHSAASDARAARYGLATMLLAADGRSSFMLAADYTNETWFDDYEVATQLGAARGSFYREGGVYRRDFERGTVLVNPTRSQHTIALGSTFHRADGDRIFSLTLEPTSGAILRGTPPVRQARVKLAAVRASYLRRPLLRKTRATLRIRGRLVVVASAGGAVSQTRGGVILARRTAKGWRVLARIRTDRQGRFDVRRRVPANRLVRVRVVAQWHGAIARSRMLVRLR